MPKYIVLIRTNRNDESYAKKQEELIKAYLEKENISNVKWLYIEINGLTQKENVKKLLENCVVNGTLLVSDLSSFGFKPDFILHLIEFLLSQKINIFFVRENFKLKYNKRVLNKEILKAIEMTFHYSSEIEELQQFKELLKDTKEIVEQEQIEEKIIVSKKKIENKILKENSIEENNQDNLEIENILEKVKKIAKDNLSEDTNFKIKYVEDDKIEERKQEADKIVKDVKEDFIEKTKDKLEKNVEEEELIPPHSDIFDKPLEAFVSETLKDIENEDKDKIDKLEIKRVEVSKEEVKEIIEKDIAPKENSKQEKEKIIKQIELLVKKDDIFHQNLLLEEVDSFFDNLAKNLLDIYKDNITHLQVLLKPVIFGVLLIGIKETNKELYFDILDIKEEAKQIFLKYKEKFYNNLSKHFGGDLDFFLIIDNKTIKLKPRPINHIFTADAIEMLKHKVHK